MTTERNVIRAKPGLLELAKQLGNSLPPRRAGVSQAGKMWVTVGTARSRLATVVDRVTPRASAPTLRRFEHWADRAAAVALHGVLIGQFIASFAAPPEEIGLDFDATDVPVRGWQEGRFSTGFTTTTAFAARCVLRRAAADRLSAALQDRCRQAPVGRSWRCWSSALASSAMRPRPGQSNGG